MIRFCPCFMMNISLSLFSPLTEYQWMFPSLFVLWKIVWLWIVGGKEERKREKRETKEIYFVLMSYIDLFGNPLNLLLSSMKRIRYFILDTSISSSSFLGKISIGTFFSIFRHVFIIELFWVYKKNIIA